MPDKIDQLYEALRKDGAVTKSRDNFRNYVLAPGDEGVQNRKALYEALKADGAVTSPTQDEFERRLEISSATSSPSTQTAPGNASNAVKQQDAAASGGNKGTVLGGTGNIGNLTGAALGGAIGALAGGGYVLGKDGKVVAQAAPVQQQKQQVKQQPTQQPAQQPTAQPQVQAQVKAAPQQVKQQPAPQATAPKVKPQPQIGEGIFIPLMKNPDSLNLRNTEAFKKGWLSSPKYDKNKRFKEARAAGFKAQGAKFDKMTDAQLVAAMREEEKKLDGSTSPQALQASMNVTYIETLMAAREWGLGSVSNLNALPHMSDYKQVRSQFNKNGLVDKYEKNLKTNIDDNPLLTIGWEKIESAYMRDKQNGSVKGITDYINQALEDPKVFEEFGAYVTARMKVKSKRWNDAVREAVLDFAARVGQDPETFGKLVEQSYTDRNEYYTMLEEIGAMWKDVNASARVDAYNNTNRAFAGAPSTAQAMQGLFEEANYRRSDPVGTLVNRLLREAPNAKSWLSKRAAGYIKDGVAKDYKTAERMARRDFESIVVGKLVDMGMPKSDTGYVLATGLLNSTAGLLTRTITTGLSGKNGGKYDQIAQQELQQYGQTKASSGARVAAAVAPLAVDIVTGVGFTGPSALGQGTKNLFTKGMAQAGKRAYGLTTKAAIRRVEQNAGVRFIGSGLSGAVNFGTYTGRNTLLQQYAQTGQVDVVEAGKEGGKAAANGFVFGVVGEGMGALTNGWTGGKALLGEGATVVVEGTTFTALDAMWGDEPITKETIAKNFGMGIAGRVGHLPTYVKNVTARYRGEVGPVKKVRLSDESYNALKGEYPVISEMLHDQSVITDISKLMKQGAPYGKKSKSKALTVYDPTLAEGETSLWEQMGKELDAMKGDSRVPWEVVRMADWVLNGTVMPEPMVMGSGVRQKEDGKYEGVVLDQNGRTITRYDLGKDEKKAGKWQSSMNDVALRNQAIVAEGLARNKSISDALLESVKGMDIVSEDGRKLSPEEITGRFVELYNKMQSGETLSVKESELFNQVMEGAEKAHPELDIVNQVKIEIKEQRGIDIDEVMKKKPSKLTQEEKQALGYFLNEITGPDIMGAEGTEIGATPATEEPYKLKGPDTGAVDELARSAMVVDSRVFTEEAGGDGMVHPATLKGEGGAGYIVSGRVLTTADGQIDLDNSDSDIIIVDENGEKRMIDIHEIAELGDILDPAELKQVAANEMLGANTPQGIEVGGRYEVSDDAGTHEVEVLRDNGNGSVEISVDGEQHTMGVEQLKQMLGIVEGDTSETLSPTTGTAQGDDNILNADNTLTPDNEMVEADVDAGESGVSLRDKAAAYVDAYFPDVKGEEREGFIEQLVAQNDFENTVRFDKEDGVNLDRVAKYEEAVNKLEEAAATENDGGEPSTAVERYRLADDIDENAIAEAGFSDNDVRYVADYLNGDLNEVELLNALGINNTSILTDAQIKSWVDSIVDRASEFVTDKPEISEADALNTGTPTTLDVDEGENVGDGEAAQGTTVEPEPEPMPMREVGKGKNKTTEPDWQAVSPERGREWLFNESGLDSTDANEIVNNNLEAAQKAVDKASKLKPKKTTNPFALQAERERIANEQAAAQSALDYWKKVKAIEQDRQAQAAAERKAKDAEVAAQAQAEEAQRQAEELAKQQEQAQRGAGAVHPAIAEKWGNAPKVEGYDNEITLANGDKIQGRYVMTESGAATPSHNALREFEKSEGFPVDENGNTVNDRDYERGGEASLQEDGAVDEGSASLTTPQTEPSKDAAIVEASKATNTEPTDAQKEAGNYKKGHVKIDGFDVSIEQPKGSVRSGVDASGKSWRQKMNNTYGYIRGTEGVDGDHIDVFLSDDPSQGDVFVVDQVNNDGSFDEHKVMYGFNSEEEARQAYLSNYEDGWQGLGAITPVSKEEFKKWVDSSHRKTKPFAEYKNVKVGETQEQEPKQQGTLFPATEQQPSSKSETKPRTTEKQPAEAPKERIDDVGEKIEGAKKDLAKKMGERINLDADTFPKMFPKYDLKKLISQGLDPNLAVMTKMLRQMAQADYKHYSKKRMYGKSYALRAARFYAAYAKQVLEAGDSNVDFKSEGLGFTDYGKQFVELNKRLFEELHKKLGDDIFDLDLTGVKMQPISQKEGSTWFRRNQETGEMEPYNPAYAFVGPRGQNYYEANELDKALQEGVEQVTKSIDYKKAHPYKLGHYYKPGIKNSDYVGVKLGGKIVPLTEPMTSSEVRKYMSEHNAELQAKAAQLDEQRKLDKKKGGTGEGRWKPELTLGGGRPRVGVDRRGGVDVEPEEFRKAFSFRGVQFGNYVTQRERQRFLNEAYDALMDMAELLGISPRAIAIDGRLGFAIGARGGGKANAHYEPKENVINLTKSKGAGSLAHEWFHALDYYFNRGNKKPTASTANKSAEQFPASTRDEMRKAFLDLMRAIKDSDYFKRSENLEMKLRSGKLDEGYYDKPTELAARAFQDYVVRKLADQGKINDFLSSFTSEEEWNGEPENYPFPIGAEAEKIDEKFDALFDAMQERTDEEGNTILYHLGKDHDVLTDTEIALRDGLVDILRSVDLDVETDEVKGQKVLDSAIQANATLQEMRGWHGSAAEFDEFDHSHMSEGEGNQAIGYGTYIASIEEIGRYYGTVAAMQKRFRAAPGYGDYDHYWKGQKIDLSSINPLRMAYDIVQREGTIKKAIAMVEKFVDNPEAHEGWRSALDILRESRKSDFKRKRANYEGERYLYEVDIPENDGTNYLPWDEPLSDAMRERIAQGLRDMGVDLNEPFERRTGKADNFDFLDEQMSEHPITGQELYYKLVDRFGRYPQQASEFLNKYCGLVGIEYPSNFFSGGNKKGLKNHVIFNEKDIKIDNRTQYFISADGVVYGFVKDGKIYIDPKIATAETPIHEYCHLWADALKRANPEAWERLKETMLGEKDVLDYVKKMYPGLEGDALVSEVFSHYSGRRGAERLRADMEREMGNAEGVFAKARVARVFDIIKRALSRFWEMARDLFAGKTRGLDRLTAEDFADMAMSDLLRGFDPRGEEYEPQARNTGGLADNFEDVPGVNKEHDEYVSVKEVEDYLKTLPNAYNVHGVTKAHSINSLESLEALKPILDQELYGEIKKRIYDPNVYGCRDSETGMIFVFTHKIWTMNHAEHNWWHENTHGAYDALELADKEECGKEAYEWLYKNDHMTQDQYEHYTISQRGSEGTARLIAYIFDTKGVNGILNGTFAGKFDNNEKIAKLATAIQNYYKYGETREEESRNRLRQTSSSSDGRDAENGIDASGRDRQGAIQSEKGSRAGEEIGRPERGESIIDEVAEDGVGYGEADDSGISDEELAGYDAGRYSVAEHLTIAKMRLAERNRNDNLLRVQAMRLFGDNLKNIRKVMAAQKKYDKKTVENIVRLTRVVMGNGFTKRATSAALGDVGASSTPPSFARGFFKDMSAYEVKRLLAAIKKGVGAEDLTPIANNVVDMLVQHQLRESKNMLHKLMQIRGRKIDSRGVEVQAGLDIDGQRMMSALKDGMSLGENGLLTRINDCENRLGSEDEVIRKNAMSEYQGLMLAKEYHDNILSGEEEEIILKDEKRQEEEKIYDFRREPVLDKDGNAIINQDGSVRTVERKTLKPQFKNNVTDENKQLRRNTEAAIERIEQSIRESRMERVTSYIDFMSDVAGDVRASRERAAAWRAEQLKRVDEIHHNANSDLQDIDPKSQTREKKFVPLFNPKNDLVRGLFMPLATFEKFMRFFGRRFHNGEGYLFDRYVRGMIDCEDKEWRSKRAAHEELDAKVTELFGKTKLGAKRHWSDLFELERKKKYPTIPVEYWDNGERMRESLSQGEALSLYVWSKQKDAEAGLRRMGISEEDMETLKGQLDPKFLQLAEWVVEEFLPKRREYYNEVHERMFGAPMAAIEHYFPIVRNSRDVEKPTDVAERNQKSTNASTITGSIIKRVRTAAALDIHTDFFSHLLKHLDDMEHFAAWAEFNRDLNTLRYYKRFKNRVSNMNSFEFGSGEDLWEAFDNCCAIVAGRYEGNAKSKLDKITLNINKGFTGGAIAFRFNTALKQLLSLPAFWSDASADQLLLYQTNPIGNFVAWKWAMQNLPGFSKRWQSRQVGDTRLMDTDMDWKLWRNKYMKYINRGGMLANAFVDAVTVASGAKAVYETKKRRYKSIGYSDEQAERKALQDAAISYNGSQQSSESGFVSEMQVDRTFLNNMLTIFRNSPFSYGRKMTTGLRELKKRLRPGYKSDFVEAEAKKMEREGIPEDKAKKAARRLYRFGGLHAMFDVFNYGYLLSFLWTVLGGSAWYLLFGEDDEKKEEIIKDGTRRTWFAPLEGFTGGNTFADKGSLLWKYATDEDGAEKALQDFVNWSWFTTPMEGETDNFLRDVRFDEQKAMWDVLSLAIQANLGFKPETFTDGVAAIVDYCDGDPQTSKEFLLCFMRVMQVPQSQTDNVYIDELGMTAKDAQKLNAMEMADRYAKYKRRKNDPLSYITHSDDEDKIFEKYRNRFLDNMQERMERLDDEQLGWNFENPNDSERRKAVGKVYAKGKGVQDSAGKKPASNWKPETRRSQLKHQRLRDYNDLAEDVLLDVAIDQAKNRGDGETEKALRDAKKELTEIKRGKHTKTIDINGLGDGSADDDKTIMEELRARRKEILQEYGIIQ